MTKENIKDILSTVTKNDVVMVITDNEHLVPTNAEGVIPIIFDDTNDRMIIIRPATDTYTQTFCPIEFVYIEYEIIQQIVVYKTMVETITALDEYKTKGLIDDDTLTKMKKLISNKVSQDFKIRNSYPEKAPGMIFEGNPSTPQQ